MASGTNAAPTVLFFGMGGVFSRAPLLALVRAGIAVRAVVMPSPARLVGGPRAAETPPVVVMRKSAPRHSGRGLALPLVGGAAEANIAEIAAERDIPVLRVARLNDPRVVAALAAYQPDVLCVACFPWRVPEALLALPRLGAVNLHPSLLPENRGPDPLFWTFWRGDERTGVTAHLMEARLDAGPILAQRELPVPEGISEADLERQCALMGGEALVEAVLALAAGTAHPRPQDETRATSYPWPEERDYMITPERPARWAHRFACGVGGRGVPPRVVVEGRVFRVLASLGYDERAEIDGDEAGAEKAGETAREDAAGAGDTRQGAGWRLVGDTLSLRCVPGLWRARVVSEMP